MAATIPLGDPLVTRLVGGVDGHLRAEAEGAEGEEVGEDGLGGFGGHDWAFRVVVCAVSGSKPEPPQKGQSMRWARCPTGRSSGVR